MLVHMYQDKLLSWQDLEHPDFAALKFLSSCQNLKKILGGKKEERIIFK